MLWNFTGKIQSFSSFFISINNFLNVDAPGVIYLLVDSVYFMIFFVLFIEEI